MKDNTLNKFTQEIKDNWLKALKSGKFTQCTGRLKKHSMNNTITYCCIGVLGEITEGLEIKEFNKTKSCPYHYLNNTIGIDTVKELYTLNDHTLSPNKDYSNVIPFIKELKVQQ